MEAYIPSNHQTDMTPEEIVNSKLSIRDLTLRDFNKLMKGIEDPTQRLLLTSLLYAQSSDLSDTLNTSFHVTPESFAGLFAQNFGPFLRLLPHEYGLDLLMEPEKIQGRNAIRFDMIISSTQVDQTYKKTYRKSSSYKEYLLNREYVESPTSRRLQKKGIKNAGGCYFYLYADGSKSLPFPAIYTRDIALASYHDSQSIALPVPLRRSEHPDSTLTHEMLLSQNALLLRLKKSMQSSFGLSYATANSNAGAHLLRTNGFNSLPNLPIPTEYRSSFIESLAYTTLRTQHSFGKVIRFSV